MTQAESQNTVVPLLLAQRHFDQRSAISFDPLSPGKSLPPVDWNSLKAVKRPGKLSGDSGRRVGVVSQIGGLQDGPFKIRRAGDAPKRRFKRMGDVARAFY